MNLNFFHITECKNLPTLSFSLTGSSLVQLVMFHMVTKEFAEIVGDNKASQEHVFLFIDESELPHLKASTLNQ